MPRQARIDAPGALQHIIIRGNARRKIFCHEADYGDFTDRLGRILFDTDTACYAWVLMSNHVHLLLRTGTVPIATVMKRVLTGYAQQFNRRHARVGHLFQNRYKSILCEEDPYFLELIRYIHLNPVRARKVKTLGELAVYPYCGHGCLLGKGVCRWQDRDSVLAQFGKTAARARRQYEAFVQEGFGQGRKPELTGGGLVRSHGGWQAVKEQLRRGIRMKGDERILGSSGFVERVLKEADEQLQKSAGLALKGVGIEMIVKRVADHYGVAVAELQSGSRNRRISEARAVVCYGAVRFLGLAGEGVAGHLHISPSAVCRAVSRGQKIVEKLNSNITLFC